MYGSLLPIGILEKMWEGEALVGNEGVAIESECSQAG